MIWGGLALWRQTAPPAADVETAPLYVAVLPTDTPLPLAAEASYMAGAFQIAMHRALLALDGVAVLAPEEVRAAYREDGHGSEGSEPSPTGLAPRLGVDEWIASRLVCEAAVCLLTLSRILAADGRLAWTESIEIPADEPLLMESVVAGRVATAFPGREWRRAAPVLSVDRADYRRFLELRRADLRGQKEVAGGGPVLSELLAITESSPHFLDAYLLAGQVARRRFFNSRDNKDLAQARTLIEGARELAPHDPRAWLATVDIEVESGRLEEAVAALDRLSELQPGNVDVFIRRGYVLQRQGQSAEALELIESAVLRRPSTLRLFDLANLQYRLGASQEAREHLEVLLARDPWSYQGKALLAEIELLHGSAERAVDLWAELVTRAPDFASLSNLGLASMLTGDYRAAAHHFARAVEMAPANAAAVLNLADVTLLAGRRDEALDLYGEVLTLVEADPDPGDLAQLTVRAQALARLERMSEAVTVLQQALHLAPDHPEVAYIAALVHAIAGEWASAEAHAKRALELGVEPRWFLFADFDPIRGPGRPLR
ncbi:MAG: tetratricopeptide repeat protein [Acidobacteriota bacterium]